MQERSTTRRALAILLAASLGFACEGGPATPRAPRDGDACDGLAYVFYMIGVNKDHGDSQREQLEKAQEGVANPFSSNPRKTLRYWQRVIELVYRRPDASADEIHALARASCTVNRGGQAVLLWPKE